MQHVCETREEWPEVKISRSSLKLTMLLCNALTHWDQGLRCLFKCAAAGMPRRPAHMGNASANNSAAGSAEQLRVAYRLQANQAAAGNRVPEARQLISH